jgi:selenoprotein W-related protein
MSKGPRVQIRYCIGCRWLLRAAWLAQEILTTFEKDIAEVALIPDGTGGVFEVHVGDVLIWSRAEQQRFPDAREIKQAVRNIVAPGRDLGHVDH